MGRLSAEVGMVEPPLDPVADGVGPPAAATLITRPMVWAPASEYGSSRSSTVDQEVGADIAPPDDLGLNTPDEVRDPHRLPAPTAGSVRFRIAPASAGFPAASR